MENKLILTCRYLYLILSEIYDYVYVCIWDFLEIGDVIIKLCVYLYKYY